MINDLFPWMSNLGTYALNAGIVIAALAVVWLLVSFIKFWRTGI